MWIKIEQEMETASSSESVSSPEPQPRQEFFYHSPESVENSLTAFEEERINISAKKRKELSLASTVVVKKEEKKSKMPIVDLTTFEEYKNLLKQYSDLALHSGWVAATGETGFMMHCDQEIGGDEIEKVCKTLQEKVQSKYKDLMFSIKSEETLCLPQLIYFRPTSTKKVFLSFNVPQLRAIAYKKVIALKLITDCLSSDYVEQFKQLCFRDGSEKADVVEEKCKEVSADIFSAVKSNIELLGKSVQITECADSDDYVILRIAQPYHQMEDFLTPFLWSLKSETINVLATTPIFNEGIVYKGVEFHSALALFSIPDTSGTPSPPQKNAFPETLIKVLARSSHCQACFNKGNVSSCDHCKSCINIGKVTECDCERRRRGYY